MNLDTDEQKEWYKIRTDQSSEHFGDCLELMPLIADESIDMILCDLPYGTTACKWDTIIPFKPLWEQYERIIKPTGVIVLTASQPFTSALVMSNPKLFRYELIFEKPNPSNPLLATKRWLSFHENILVFYKNTPTYNPQKVIRLEKNKRDERKNNRISTPDVIGNAKIKAIDTTSDTKHSSSVLKFNRELGLHPTQKPVPLFKTLINSFTNENETILDNTAGVFTTAIACLETNRKYIVMEKEQEYYNKGIKRILEWKQSQNGRLF